MLRDISGSSSADIWTVGDKNQPGSSVNTENLVLHYDGTAWTELAAPAPPLSNGTLASLWAVQAFGPTDVWAAGDYAGIGSIAKPQLLHWDGTAWTSLTQQLANAAQSSFLWGLDGLTPQDIWAVGNVLPLTAPGLPTYAYALHYDGTAWTPAPVPPLGTYRNRFDAVSILTPNDVWAVGTWGNSRGDFRYLIAHYDGTAWTNVALPPALAGIQGELFAVQAIAPNDVWATGGVETGGSIMLHWDGTAWSQVPSPTVGASLAALGPNNIWCTDADIAHWDGSSWTIVDSLAAFHGPVLSGTTILPDGEVWAAGREMDTTGAFTSLVYRNNTPAPRVRISASAPTLPPGGTVQLTATPSAPGTYQYSWSPVTGLSNPGSATPTASPTVSTTYTVTMTDPATGAVAQATFLLRVGGPTGLAAFPDRLAVRAWPNPFTEAVTCTVSAARAEAATLEVTDALGRVVVRQSVALRAGNNQVALQPAVRAGVYTLAVRTAGWQQQIRLLRQ